MDPIRYGIEKPVSVTVGVILVVMFGLIGLNKLPVQLTPDVEAPQITVNTIWGGSTPYEVEKEVIEKQEEALKGLQGLTKMESSAYNSYGEITLTFQIGTDLDDALLRVSNKMNEVSDYPETADRPVINAAGAQSSPVIWMMLKPKPDNPEPIAHYRTFFEDNVRQHLERVRGVGDLFVFGGTENELQITIDQEKLARYRVTIDQVIGAVRGANRNISAGVLGIKKKNYRIRTVSQFQKPEDALDVVIFDDGVKRVYLRDVASATAGYKKQDVSVLHNGQPVVVVGVRKEQGANVLAMTDRMEEAVKELNEGMLARQNLYIDWVYDQRPYINTAIDLVKENVLIGGILAVIVLMLFLRSFRSTTTTAVAIPISVIGSFISLWLLGRNLNVVSLAGISFAVGMLVDNSIVVLENIDRHRQMGKVGAKAAYDGTKEVWGAVLASTLTTIAVFLPVIFMEEEAGQLFQDIAIAISSAIFLSLIVSVTVIPTLMNLFYRDEKPKPPNRWQKSRLGPWLATRLHGFADLCMKNASTRISTVLIFTSLSVGIIIWLIPSAEYLPQGNRNLILNILIPPPGYSVDKMKDLGQYIYEESEPYFGKEGKDGFPGIRQMFFVGADRVTLFGGLSTSETRARELIPLFSRIMNSIPGIFGVSIQAGIFESGIGKGRTVEVNVSGEDINAIVNSSLTLFGAIKGKIPAAQIRPVPTLETSYPEVRIVPIKEKLVANGLTEQALGEYVDILMDGRVIDEFRPEGVKQVDLAIKGGDLEFSSPEAVMEATIVNRYGDLIRVGDLARLEYNQGMPQINHLERKRTITLQVTPPGDLALQSAMETIQNDVINSLRDAGQLEGVEVGVGGNADKLVLARNALQWNLLLAILITYLLMAALFENFFYPMIILFTVPLAAAGGFIGIRLVNALVAPQGFDIVAMLGFIILIGTVVNNAILIVHQSLNNVRYNGMVGIPAISEAVSTRIRPIFMSATTSVLGMSPLVLATGAGSELYRGLGSILLGGLAISTLFTLFVIPSLLAFFIGYERSRADENS